MAAFVYFTYFFYVYCFGSFDFSYFICWLFSWKRKWFCVVWVLIETMKGSVSRVGKNSIQTKISNEMDKSND
ncbi:hypothetical protein L1887_11240 [Cichorium endivia]|nr:hypothetical protein L1887_11240 [Cichorium endivia]